MADGFIGRKLVLAWGEDPVPGVREKTVALNGEAVDTTSDDDNGWRTLLDDPAENQIDLSVSGVTKSRALKEAWFTGPRTQEATFTYPNGDVITGEFYLASYSETGTYNEATTFEAEFQSTGVVTFTAGSGGA